VFAYGRRHPPVGWSANSLAGRLRVGPGQLTRMVATGMEVAHFVAGANITEGSVSCGLNFCSGPIAASQPLLATDSFQSEAVRHL